MKCEGKTVLLVEDFEVAGLKSVVSICVFALVVDRPGMPNLLCRSGAKPLDDLDLSRSNYFILPCTYPGK